MNNGTIVQTIIIIAFALFGTFRFVQTSPIYMLACYGLGILIAAAIPAIIYYSRLEYLYYWWYYDRDNDMLG